MNAHGRCIAIIAGGWHERCSRTATVTVTNDGRAPMRYCTQHARERGFIPQADEATKLSNFRRSARNHAFRELRKLAARVEWHANLAADRRACIRGMGTLEFHESKMNERAEDARKLAVEYAGFIARGSYVQ